MLAAERLVEPALPSLAALLLLLLAEEPLLVALPFLPFLSLPLRVPPSESIAALPLAASRLLTLSCNFCMISECDRSVPAIGTEPRSVCENEDRDDRGFRAVALGALEGPTLSSICMLATPARVLSAAVSSESPRDDLCASVSAAGLRLGSAETRLADEELVAPSKGEGVNAATDVTEEDGIDATVSAAGDLKSGDLR